MMIVLRPTDDGRTATITTPRGRFAGPDQLIEIHPTAGVDVLGSARVEEVS